MPSRLVGLRIAAVFSLILAGASSATAQSSGSATKSTPPRPVPTKGGASTAKGPLPDPALLDGSTLPVDKKSETGMIGDFELPGDENVRDGKVGGPQLPAGQSGGQQGQQGLPNPMSGGGQQGAQSSAGQQGGQQGGQAGGEQSAGQQGGAQAGGAQQGTAQAGGAQAGGPGDPQGMQVGGLAGEGTDPAQAVGQVGNKPQQVAIGDSAMRIETQAGAQNVIGATQQAGPTQQHDKGTGSGGKGASGSGGNKGVERGRAMPAGL